MSVILEREKLTELIGDSLAKRNTNAGLIEDAFDGVDTELLLQDADIQANEQSITLHKNDTMPHRFHDLKNEKIYRYGFQVSLEGNPQMIYEEIV